MSEPFTATDVLWLVFAEVKTGTLSGGDRARRDLPVMAFRTYDEATESLLWLRHHPRLGTDSRQVSYSVWPHPIPIVKTTDDLRVVSTRAMDFD